MAKTEAEILKELKEEIKGLNEDVKELQRQLETREESGKELSEELEKIAQMLNKNIGYVDGLNRSIKKLDKDKWDLMQENRKLKKIIKENGLEIGNYYNVRN